MRNISLLAWMLSVSAATNVITMLGVLYIAFGTPKVYVADGYVATWVRNSTPIGVQISKP
jgi:hypothetical protein